MKEHLGNKLAYYHFQFDDQALNHSLIATSWRNNFDLSICFRELLIAAGTGTVSRFVPVNERGSSDINTVSSPHVESVCLLVNQNVKSKRHVNVGIDAEEYYRIKKS